MVSGASCCASLMAGDAGSAVSAAGIRSSLSSTSNSAPLFPHYELHQVKEKFGGLRFSWSEGERITDPADPEPTLLDLGDDADEAGMAAAQKTADEAHTAWSQRLERYLQTARRAWSVAQSAAVALASSSSSSMLRWCAPARHASCAGRRGGAPAAHVAGVRRYARSAQSGTATSPSTTTTNDDGRGRARPAVSLSRGFGPALFRAPLRICPARQCGACAAVGD